MPLDHTNLRADARRHIATEGCVPVLDLTKDYEGEDLISALDVVCAVLREHLAAIKKACGRG